MQLYRAHWQHLAGIALLVYLVVGLLSVVLAAARTESVARERAWSLVSGHGWNVFGAIVAAWLVLVVAGIVIAAVTAPFADAGRCVPRGSHRRDGHRTVRGAGPDAHLLPAAGVESTAPGPGTT